MTKEEKMEKMEKKKLLDSAIWELREQIQETEKDAYDATTKEKIVAVFSKVLEANTVTMKVLEKEKLKKKYSSVNAKLDYVFAYIDKQKKKLDTMRDESAKMHQEIAATSAAEYIGSTPFTDAAGKPISMSCIKLG